ncbi:MAG: hypothetical protein JW864_14115 [Spirochaetes bacterium]|nr:hypothetical protein [Spirochaetota bacterium]
MKSIEKTKKNIGLSEIDEFERKKLFNDFVEAGGEVIKEKEKRGLQDFDRDLQRRYKKHLENYKNLSKAGKNDTLNKSERKNGYGQKEIKASDTSAVYVSYEVSKIRLLFQRIRIRFRLFFLKITDFTGTFLNPKFLNSIDSEYKSSLFSFQRIFTDFFKNNIRIGKKITDQLDKMHPVYFELLELLSKIFDRGLINEILEHYYNFPDIQQPAIELKDSLTKLFRKIYPLFPYKSHIFSALEKANNIYARTNNKKNISISRNKKKFKNDIYLIFDKLYPRLYWLMCYYEGRIFLTERDLENSIEISLEDIPGKRRKDESRQFDFPYYEDISDEEDKNNEQKDITEAVSESIKKGLNVMYNIDIDKLSKICISSNKFPRENLNDKVYITSLLFDEFDREYSFLLTTNKIKYNIFSQSGDKVDYKNKFINIYNDVTKCKNRLNDYAETVSAYEKLKQEKPISNTQFIEYSNRLKALEEERIQTGINTRMYVKSFFENLCKELNKLITDMNTTKEIIVNPEDIVVFDMEIEGNKKLNNKKIKDIISRTYDFSMAFIYRLESEGDLYGNMEFKEEKKKFLEKSIRSGKKITQEADKGKNNSGNNSSILDELDDLV